MGDILFITAFLGLLLVPKLIFALKRKTGFWEWVGTVAAMGAVLGLGELWSKLATGKTLSSNFWAFSLDDPGSAIVILVCWGLAWGLLLLHLAWKMLRKKS